MSKMAAESGHDVWCEKPMTRTIGEGIKVVEAIQKTGRMFRLNTWFRFKDQFYGLGTTVKPLKETRRQRSPRMASKGNCKRYNRLRLEILLERPSKPQTRPFLLNSTMNCGSDLLHINLITPKGFIQNSGDTGINDGGGLGDMVSTISILSSICSARMIPDPFQSRLTPSAAL